MNETKLIASAVTPMAVTVEAWNRDGQLSITLGVNVTNGWKHKKTIKYSTESAMMAAFTKYTKGA